MLRNVKLRVFADRIDLPIYAENGFVRIRKLKIVCRIYQVGGFIVQSLEAEVFAVRRESETCSVCFLNASVSHSESVSALLRTDIVLIHIGCGRFIKAVSERLVTVGVGLPVADAEIADVFKVFRHYQLYSEVWKEGSVLPDLALTAYRQTSVTEESPYNRHSDNGRRGVCAERRFRFNDRFFAVIFGYTAGVGLLLYAVKSFKEPASL